MGRQRLDSLKDFIHHGLNLRIRCKCGHTVDASAVALWEDMIGQLDFDDDIDRLERRFRCKKCRRRGARIHAIFARF